MLGEADIFQIVKYGIDDLMLTYFMIFYGSNIQKCLKECKKNLCDWALDMTENASPPKMA